MGMTDNKNRSVKDKDYPKVPTIIGEDSGGWSRTKEKPMSVSIALTKTSLPNEFAEIATRYDWNTRNPKDGRAPIYDDKELKFRSSSDDVRKSVLNEIASMNPDIHISSDDRPNINTGHTKRYKRLFRFALEDALPGEGDLATEFIMDESTFMTQNAGKTAVKEVAGSSVEYHSANSEKDVIVQTQDFVAGAANASRKGNNEYIDIVREFVRSWRIEK